MTVKQVEKLSTAKELQVAAKDMGIKNVTKFKKEDLKAELISQIEEALKPIPVDGPAVVLEAIEAIENQLPEYFETSEDLSTDSIPHLTRTLGEKLAADTVVLHADFGKAGTKQARVYIIQKCFGQRNSTLHIFGAQEADKTVKFLKLLAKNRS